MDARFKQPSAHHTIENLWRCVHWRRNKLSAHDGENIRCRPFADESTANKNRFFVSSWRNSKHGQQIAQKSNGFNFAAMPPFVLNHGARSGRGRFELFNTATLRCACKDSRHESLWRHMCPRRCSAARNLHIDRCVWPSIFLDQRSRDRLQLRSVESFNASQRKTACKSRDMQIHSNRPSAEKTNDFINAVSKEKTSIKDADLGILRIDESTVEPYLHWKTLHRHGGANLFIE